jgi:hypothetical protein
VLIGGGMQQYLRDGPFRARGGVIEPVGGNVEGDTTK